MEQRNFPRLQANLKATLWNDQSGFQGTVVNLSPEGALIRLETQQEGTFFPPRQTVRIDFVDKTRNSSFQDKGLVVREVHKPDDGHFLAVRFN